MMTIRQCLESYQREDLSFNQIMELYLQGKIKLDNGEVSVNDLRIIREQCDLPNYDSKKIKRSELIEPAPPTTIGSADDFENQLQNIDADQLEEEAFDLEREIFNYDRDWKKQASFFNKCATRRMPKRSDKKKLDEVHTLREALFKKRVRLAECCELLYVYDQSDPKNLLHAIKQRIEATKLYEIVYIQRDHVLAAENKVCFAKLQSRQDDSFLVQDLLEGAREHYTLYLEKISPPENNRAEEHAKLAEVCLLLFKKTENREYLEQAVKEININVDHDSERKYFNIFKDIKKAVEDYK